ncbi:isocitrate lyase/phosphoenolpyruvate mutase family protein [Rhodobacteraceae bacterium NNCM2]|nr:isocitrate lyase/phosphoenolpyruvate mutase family protein [Coraliihabitans acroporae]
MKSQHEKADLFRAAHQPGNPLVLPNAWDVGSARMLAGMGFQAIATTSAGFAFSQGDMDRIGVTSREAALAHARDLVEAVDLPVSADLEDGFGPTVEDVAATVRGAIDAGLVGGTIEDTTGDKSAPIYPFDEALARVEAAVAAARDCPFPFTLTARAENFLHGRPDLDDTIKRLQAFEAAGADCLYAPGLPDLDAIKAVCASVTKPVNVVIGIRPKGISIRDLADAGVARISLGSSLARRAYGALIEAGREILDQGTFTAAEAGAPFAEIEALLTKSRP